MLGQEKTYSRKKICDDNLPPEFYIKIKEILKESIEFLNNKYYGVDNFTIEFNDTMFFVEHEGRPILRGCLSDFNKNLKKISDFLSSVLSYADAAKFYPNFKPRMF